MRTTPILASAGMAVAALGAPGSAQETLFVSTFQSGAGQILRFDLPSPAPTVIASGLDLPEDGACSPVTKLLYFALPFSNSVRRWDQGGGNMTVIVPTAGTVVGPEGPNFDLAGNLYVHSRQIGASTDGAWRLQDGDPANPLAQIVTPFTAFGEGSEIILAGPHAGALMLVARGEQQVYMSKPPGANLKLFVDTPEFQGATGELYGVVTNGCGELFVTLQISSTDSGIYRFDAQGKFLEVYASLPGSCSFLDFDSAGNLYVACISPGQVFRIDPAKNATVFASVPQAHGLAICRDKFVPDCSSCPQPPSPKASTPAPQICAGGSAPLDASGSTGCGAGGLEYRWLDASGNVICPWSPSPACSVSPGASATYTLEARCLADPVCSAAATVAIEVVPYPQPVLAPMDPICAGGLQTLDATGTDPNGCPVPLEYQFRDGAAILKPWSASPTCGPFAPPVGTTTYTVEARCTASPGCAASASASVTVENCPLAVRWDELGAGWQTPPHGTAVVAVRWRTTLEDGTNYFLVERSGWPEGPFVAVGAPIEAQGAGYRYRFEDPTAAAGTRPWYRVVELTAQGRGDATPGFQAAGPGCGGRRGRSRRGER